MLSCYGLTPAILAVDLHDMAGISARKIARVNEHTNMRLAVRPITLETESPLLSRSCRRFFTPLAAEQKRRDVRDARRLDNPKRRGPADGKRRCADARGQ